MFRIEPIILNKFEHGIQSLLNTCLSDLLPEILYFVYLVLKNIKCMLFYLCWVGVVLLLM